MRIIYWLGPLTAFWGVLACHGCKGSPGAGAADGSVADSANDSSVGNARDYDSIEKSDPVGAATANAALLAILDDRDSSIILGAVEGMILDRLHQRQLWKATPEWNALVARYQTVIPLLPTAEAATAVFAIHVDEMRGAITLACNFQCWTAAGPSCLDQGVYCQAKNVAATSYIKLVLETLLGTTAGKLVNGCFVEKKCTRQDFLKFALTIAAEAAFPALKTVFLLIQIANWLQAVEGYRQQCLSYQDTPQCGDCGGDRCAYDQSCIDCNGSSECLIKGDSIPERCAPPPDAGTPDAAGDASSDGLDDANPIDGTIVCSGITCAPRTSGGGIQSIAAIGVECIYNSRNFGRCNGLLTANDCLRTYTSYCDDNARCASTFTESECPAGVGNGACDLSGGCIDACNGMICRKGSTCLSTGTSTPCNGIFTFNACVRTYTGYCYGAAQCGYNFTESECSSASCNADNSGCGP
jgi:hypothetical protein